VIRKRRRINADPRTRALCMMLGRFTSNSPSRFRTIGPIARAAGLNDCEAEAAMFDAAKKGWLLTAEEAPYSIALTDDGEKMVATWVKRAAARSS
jgi:hypothetical protein